MMKLFNWIQKHRRNKDEIEQLAERESATSGTVIVWSLPSFSDTIRWALTASLLSCVVSVIRVGMLAPWIV